ncbi:hypothetical protein MTO96_005193 [Rhipicephalus appendiculatus]
MGGKRTGESEAGASRGRGECEAGSPNHERASPERSALAAGEKARCGGAAFGFRLPSIHLRTPWTVTAR